MNGSVRDRAEVPWTAEAFDEPHDKPLRPASGRVVAPLAAERQ